MRNQKYGRYGYFVVLMAVMFALTSCVSGGNSGTPAAPAAEKAKPVAGVYTNAENSFSVNYPPNWEKKPLKGDEVLRVVNNNAWGIPLMVVSVSDLAADAVKLEDAAPGYFEAMKKENPNAKRFKILSKEMIKLNDGTDALTITFKYSMDATTKLQCALLQTYKNEKVISVITITILGGKTSPDKLLEMAKTYRFL